MKCDAGEIACAIDRLTDAADRVSTYDWWSDIGIPVILGLLTIAVTTGVAIASVLVARRSNALARQSNALARLSINLARKAEDDARTSARLHERIALGQDLVEMLTAFGHERRGTQVSPSASDLHRLLRTRLAFLGEPNSMKVLSDVTHAFDGAKANTLESRQDMSTRQITHELRIGAWVRDPLRYSDAPDAQAAGGSDEA